MSKYPSKRQESLIKILLVIVNIFFITAIILMVSGYLSVNFNIADDSTNTEKVIIPDEFANRIELSCDSIPKDNLMVALVFGQSNSANYIEGQLTTKKNVYNFYEQRCFTANDPLLGATGTMGSVWTRFGDRIIEDGTYDNVLLVPIGVGGSGIRRWTPSGALHRKIIYSIEDLREHGLEITHMLWHQGEQDSLIIREKQRYKDMFNEMLAGIRGMGVKAPFYVSIVSMTGVKISEEIQEAQRELVDPSRGVFQGPNTDLLGKEFRYDGLHFSAKGAEKIADMWLESLKAGEKIYPSTVKKH